MGGQYNSFTSDAKDFKALQVEFQQARSEDQYENGHLYSGGFGGKEGVRNTGKVFDSIDEAEDWIGNNNDKWDYADAVQFKVNGKETTASQNARKKHNEKVGLARQNLESLKVKIKTEIATAKSQFKACRHCKSKINKKFISGAKCPACHTDMLSPTQQNRLHRLELKLDEAETARERFKPKYTSGGKKLRWLVGGWCSS